MVAAGEHKVVGTLCVPSLVDSRQYEAILCAQPRPIKVATTHLRNRQRRKLRQSKTFATMQDSLEDPQAQTYSTHMDAITLKAHFDGQQILLDEPFDLPANTPLIVTVLTQETELERADWTQAAAAGLARAYGNNEPEYSRADVKHE